MKRDAAAALLAAMIKPCVKVTSAPSMTRSGMTYSPDYSPRTRDRIANTAVNAELNPAPQSISTEEELYRNETKNFGVAWANIYRAQRLAKSKEERIAAENARVAAARRADDARRAQDQRDAEVARQKQTRETAKIVFANADKSAIRDMLKDEPIDVMQAVIASVKAEGGSTLPFVWAAHLAKVKEEKS